MNAPVEAAASLPTEDRTTYLGGSDIGAVVGLSPYATALDVWAAKVDGIEKSVGPAAEVGIVLEPAIFELYLRRFPVAAVDVLQPGTVRDPSLPWAAATPDRVIRLREGQARNVQIKGVGVYMGRRWGAEEDGPDGVPPDVLAQVHWEARAIEKGLGLRCELSHVPMLLGTELRVYEVPTDRELLELLEDAAADFWREHVEARRMPEITEENAASANAWIKARFARETGPIVEATPELVELARTYHQAAEAMKAAEWAKETAGARLKLAIGEAAGFATEDGLVKATFKAKKSNGVDWKALAAELGTTPEIEKKHTRPGSRALRVTVKEEA